MGLGFVFEGEALAQEKSQGHSNSTRLFSFKPHFEVALRDPDGVDVVSYLSLKRDPAIHTITGRRLVRRFQVPLHPSFRLVAISSRRIRCPK